MKRLAVTVMMMGIAAVSLTAEAGDTKFYPATMCQGFVPQPYQSQIFVGSTPVIVPGVYVAPATYATSGAAMNPSSSYDMTVVCPLVRDVVRTDGLGLGGRGRRCDR